MVCRNGKHRLKHLSGVLKLGPRWIETASFTKDPTFNGNISIINNVKERAKSYVLNEQKHLLRRCLGPQRTSKNTSHQLLTCTRVFVKITSVLQVLGMAFGSSCTGQVEKTGFAHELKM